MKFLSLAFVGFVAVTLAHPGHQEPEHELLYKRAFNAQARRGLQACYGELEHRGFQARANERRKETVEYHRQKLKTKKLALRDTDTIANTSHLSSECYTPSTSETTIFNSSSTCILNPEGETGPFYVPGEFIRPDLRESQPGVPIVIEGQFLDVTTCEPIEGIWWDLYVR